VEAKGLHTERADIIRDLDRVQEVEKGQDKKCCTLRTQIQGRYQPGDKFTIQRGIACISIIKKQGFIIYDCVAHADMEGSSEASYCRL